ncbi:MAG: hypothetical protein IPN88_08660 [Bacteroidetes bacterium]|nr:hypothetical protein [Bacteroidota bacterium]
MNFLGHSNEKKKEKLLNLLLVLTSFIGYLEWGKENHLFLLQAEVEIISKFISNPSSVIHPFILLPFVGQLLLIVTLFQAKPNKTLTYFGISGLGLLLGFMFIVGMLSLNYKIIVSTIPFLFLAILTIKYRQDLSRQ